MMFCSARVAATRNREDWTMFCSARIAATENREVIEADFSAEAYFRIKSRSDTMSQIREEDEKKRNMEICVMRIMVFASLISRCNTMMYILYKRIQ